MADVTEADTDKAYRALWPLTRYRWPRDDEITDEQRAQVERVAAALTEEREKARAPFLALADELKGWQDLFAKSGLSERADTVEGAIARLRTALAEEG